MACWCTFYFQVSISAVTPWCLLALRREGLKPIGRADVWKDAPSLLLGLLRVSLGGTLVLEPIVFALVAELLDQALVELYSILLTLNFYLVNIGLAFLGHWAGAGIRRGDPRWRRRCLVLLLLQLQRGRTSVTLGSLCFRGNPVTTRNGGKESLSTTKRWFLGNDVVNQFSI